MKWHEVSISTAKNNEDAFSSFLNEISKGISVEHSLELLKENVEDFDDKYRLDPSLLPERDIRILVYFDETEDIEEKMARIDSFITGSELDRKEDILVERKMIDEEDWENEWKKYFHSFRVSENFVIVPSWEIEDYEFKKDDKLIKLDPGMAFGTGDHPTTSMCLKFIERIVEPKHKIIDVGTGSGILTIGAHLMGARNLKATDIDELSLKVARENFELNECASDVSVETGDLLTTEDDQYDIVIANILAHIIDRMIDDAFETLKFGGVFIASGIITKRRDDIIKHMEKTGFDIVEVLEDNGWVSIMAKKA
ncbi:50S ribosomal protein L11 methyltransferase [Salinicoccus halodurans]|uniref:Ribosomal protein L11 methyltransferase n=1 Tax=Salinicoccus halodurans TaxID=407035 RepID=A0A0F7HLI0_9STAP|nr:50S ribosomal protein L11 methyltransferase [Salinicoccus halodurans]AKG73954.1 ribosomal protein L11 methyltransferase [Salinicoccus halodurans]SFK58402.1 ribosomal protein L11 methyltransferase [Salinicoccus halodurans]